MRARATLLLLAAAVLLRPGLARADARDDKYYYDDIYAPFFVPDPARPGWLKAARDGSTAAPIEQKKPAGTLRVFIIGGSTAGGYNGDGDLAWGLKNALPGRRVEVVNCGMAGYDSYREQLVLEDVARYEPDIVVLLSGHNDFFIHRAAPPAWARRLAAPLARFGWFRRLQRSFVPDRGAAELASRGVRDASLADLLKNLDAHLATTRRSGARAVVCVPPVDYAEMGTSLFGLPWADAGFSRGWAAWLRGKPEEAEAAWRGRLGEGPVDDVLGGALWNGVGRAQIRLGRREEALASFGKALDFEAGADVCGASCLEAQRRLAHERGALVADADAAFVEAARPGVPDGRFFVDEIHWNPALHAVVTRALVDAMRADPALSKLGWSQAPLPAPRIDAAAAERRHRQALLFMAAQRVELHPFFSQRALEWLEAAERLDPSLTFTPATLTMRAQEAYDEYDPSAPGLHRSALPRREVAADRLLGYYGALQLEKGRYADAERALKTASAKTGLRDFAALHAVALALSGKKAEATQSLAVLRAEGFTPESETLAAALGLGELPRISLAQSR